MAMRRSPPLRFDVAIHVIHGWEPYSSEVNWRMREPDSRVGTQTLFPFGGWRGKSGTYLSRPQGVLYHLVNYPANGKLQKMADDTLSTTFAALADPTAAERF